MFSRYLIIVSKGLTHSLRLMRSNATNITMHVVLRKYTSRNIEETLKIEVRTLSKQLAVLNMTTIVFQPLISLILTFRH